MPVGESKYDWYTKMAKAIELFAPRNSRYAIIGEDNIDIIKYGGNLISDETIDKTSQRYLIGKIGRLDIYADKHFGGNIAYEPRFSKEDIENNTDTSFITGLVEPKSINLEA